MICRLRRWEKPINYLYMLVQKYKLFHKITELVVICCNENIRFTDSDIIENKFITCPKCGRQYYLELTVEALLKIKQLGEPDNQSPDLRWLLNEKK